jgi:hypothetical protein
VGSSSSCRSLPWRRGRYAILPSPCLISSLLSRGQTLPFLTRIYIDVSKKYLYEGLYRIPLTKVCIIEKLVCFVRGDEALKRAPNTKSLAIISSLLKDERLGKADSTTRYLW